MDLAELLHHVDARHVAGPAPAGVRIADITEDSRTAVPGSLFVARSGLKSDGKAHAAGAIAAGATAVLCDDPLWRPESGSVSVISSGDVPGATARMAEHFYGSPSSKLTLIGVTGTNGKTTVAHLVHQLLNQSRARCGLIGTVMTDDGREVAPTGMTTPPAIELSRTLATMVEHGCRSCVMEVSSHALAQDRAVALAFDVGVFTNLTGDHIDYHGSMDAYADAKAKLFEMLPREGSAVINADDEWHERMLSGCDARALRCHGLAVEGAAEGDHRRCAVTRLAHGGPSQRLRMSGPWGAIETTVGLIGDHNAMNVLQAAAAAHAAGISLGLDAAASGSQLAIALPRLKPPPGRLERVNTDPPAPPDAPLVLVDYAHTDDGLRHALTAARSCAGPDAHVIAVFGCGGERDTTKRPRMGAVAAELADRVIITSDNPRTEKPSVIIDQILAGVPGPRRAAFEIHPERERAIAHAVASARPGDVLLVAGKGHETEQIELDSAGRLAARPFDDRERCRAALAAWTSAHA